METNRRTIAFVLIAIGAIALLARLSGDAGWLWVGLVSIGFLYYYARERTYGLLVVGSILAGVAVGLLLEGNWGWEGAFLVSLGVGIGVIDRVDTRANRWPFYLGAVLIVLGLVSGLIESGLLGSAWFALLLIVAGVLLLRRGGSGWVRAPEPPEGEAAAPASPAPSDAAPGGPAPAGPAPAVRAAPAPAVAPDGAAAPSPDGVAVRRAALERWREATAAREDRSPMLVLNDDTLQLLAERDPRSLDELAQVKGIGPVKLERYGDALLAVLRTA